MAEYEKTEIRKEKMSNMEFDTALQEDYENLKKTIGWGWYSTKTGISYKAGSTEAYIWNEGEKKKTKIFLPLNDGWYLTDKKYGIPNGEPSNSSNPAARHLYRWQDRDFEGFLVRGYDFFGFDRRVVNAYYVPRDRFGVRRVGPPKPNKVPRQYDEDEWSAGYSAGRQDLKKKILKLLEEEGR